MNDDPHAAIATAAASLGIAPPPSPLLADSGVIRYHDHLNDRPGQKNGWYIVISNPDGTTGGTVGSHKLQVSCNWCTSSNRTFTPVEKAEFARKQAEARATAEADRLRRAAEAEAKAARLWPRSRPADPLHPYIVKKGVQTHRARQLGDSLVLDYRNSSGTITTLQFIAPDGQKRFLSGGIVSGSSYRFGPKITDTVICCEGWSTGATLHEATGYPVCVCGSAGNIGPVAVGIRELLPTVSIIIAGDGDPVGRQAAESAAELVNGIVCLPDFSGEVGDDGR